MSRTRARTTNDRPNARTPLSGKASATTDETRAALRPASRGLWFWLLVPALVVATPWSMARAQLTHAGRWLKYDGQYLYMVGIDLQSVVGAEPWHSGSDGYDGDYTRILDELQTARINKVRIWANVFFRPADQVQQPFKQLSNGRYDLNQWNDTYWARLKDFVSKAKQRHIMVEYCLFSQYPHADMADGTRDSNYWAAAVNVNGAFNDTDSTNGLLFEFFKDQGGTISGHPFSYYQDRLIAKAVSEIGGYGNVFFLVMNEPDTTDVSAFPWMRSRASTLKAQGNVLVAVELRPDPWQGRGSIQEDLHEFWDDSDVDIVGGHAYDTDPTSVGNKLHDAQLKGKILHDNEGHGIRTETDQAVREAWGWAMAGGYYSFYSRDRDFSKIGDSTWDTVIAAATTLRDVFESVPFWNMSPVDATGAEYDSLVSQAPGSSGWQVFAEPGLAYIVYTWGTPTSHALQIQLAAGNYTYRWVNARNGSIVGTGQLDGGQTASIAAPATGQWSGTYGLALVVKTTANQPPVVSASAAPQTMALPNAVTQLTATVTDDGLPNPPATVTTTWSKVSGPGDVQFSDDTARQTQAQFTVAGDYVLRITADDSDLTASDDVTVHVQDSADIDVPRSTSPITVDGAFDDPAWNKAPAFDVDKVIGGTISSPSDLSASVRFLWDDDYFYIALSVTDDVLVSDSGADYFQDDGLELYFDANNDKAKSYGTNDFQWYFRHAEPIIKERHHDMTQGVLFAQQDTSHGYAMEIGLPWANVGQILPISGGLIGLEVQVDDDDDGGARDKSVHLFSPLNETWHDPSTMGSVHLVEAANPNDDGGVDAARRSDGGTAADAAPSADGAVGGDAGYQRSAKVTGGCDCHESAPGHNPSGGAWLLLLLALVALAGKRTGASR
ncbi:MAG: hypothetical protein J7M25_10325 [Deltaproteobacteria bacterium]|nr:hypothetical protein [Deltaproteobacteria bacterium]